MIRVENLSRSFGSFKAVKEISFTVEKGDILGFIGPNGAGKSTTMRMITGYLTPSSGQVFIDDLELSKNEALAKSKIGYLPESAPMYSEMTVESFLKFAADIRGLKGKAKKEAVDKVLELCFLEDRRHQIISTLSKGYKQRACFAQAIIHNPPVLILDEPTDGLDPNQKRKMREIIRDFGKDKAVIFSTHILEEVELICTRVILIDQGVKKIDESKDEFIKKSDSLHETFYNLTTGDQANA